MWFGMKKRILRDSNYELLRLISMFLIVLWHVIAYGKVIENSTGITNLIFNVIMFICIIHVNSFMLITGYYQSKSKFRLSKFLSFLLQLWFYNFLINLILKLSGAVTYTNIDFLLKTSFFNTQAHWYLRCYLIIYLLSPFLNKLVNGLDKRMFKRLIIILFLCFCLAPFLTTNLFYATDGYTVIQYIFLYFVGAYIRKYNSLDVFLSKLNITQKRFIYFMLFLFFFSINLGMHYFGQYLASLNSNTLKYVASNILTYKYNYNNPVTLLESLSIFLFFGTFQFKNRGINYLSSLTLGIYLIHQQEYIKQNLYRWIGIYTGEQVGGSEIITKVIIWAIIIFVLCAIIEMIRQLLFKAVNKLTISRKINMKVIAWFNRLFEVNN